VDNGFATLYIGDFKGCAVIDKFLYQCFKIAKSFCDLFFEVIQIVYAPLQIFDFLSSEYIIGNKNQHK